MAEVGSQYFPCDFLIYRSHLVRARLGRDPFADDDVGARGDHVEHGGVIRDCLREASLLPLWLSRWSD